MNSYSTYYYSASPFFIVSVSQFVLAHISSVIQGQSPSFKNSHGSGHGSCFLRGFRGKWWEEWCFLCTSSQCLDFGGEVLVRLCRHSLVTLWSWPTTPLLTSSSDCLDFAGEVLVRPCRNPFLNTTNLTGLSLRFCPTCNDELLWKTCIELFRIWYTSSRDRKSC